jgi:hypothetical protein
MKKMLLAFAAFSMLLLSSCDKDDDDENDEASLTKESLAGNYKLTSARGKTALIEERDVMDFLVEPCQKDDILTLNADLTYAYKDEGTECSPSRDETGTWTLNGDQIDVGPYEFKITQWDGKILQGTTTRSIEVFPGVSQEATITLQFTRQ